MKPAGYAQLTVVASPVAEAGNPMGGDVYTAQVLRAIHAATGQKLVVRLGENGGFVTTGHWVQAKRPHNATAERALAELDAKYRASIS